jgi:hypothetical protein
VSLRTFLGLVSGQIEVNSLWMLSIGSCFLGVENRIIFFGGFKKL